jgi:hypothetical protein
LEPSFRKYLKENLVHFYRIANSCCQSGNALRKSDQRPVSWSSANQLRRIKTGANFPGQMALATDTPKRCLLTVIVFNKLYKLLQVFLFQLEDQNGTYMVLRRNVAHHFDGYSGFG